MPDKPPIPLDYNTPEKGEPVTPGIILGRVILGFGGFSALIFALGFTAFVTWDLVIDRSKTSARSTADLIVCVVLGLMAWIISFVMLKYAIVGAPKSRSAQNDRMNEIRQDQS